MGDTPGIVRFSPGIAEIYDLKSVVCVRWWVTSGNCIPHIYMGNNAYFSDKLQCSYLGTNKTIDLLDTHVFMS